MHTHKVKITQDIFPSQLPKTCNGVFCPAHHCWCWLPLRQFRTASGLPHVPLKYRFWKAAGRWHSGKRHYVVCGGGGKEEAGAGGGGGAVLMQMYSPGLIRWQTQPTPSHLNWGQQVWHIFCWQNTSPAQHPAAAGMYTAVFLHLTLHHRGRRNRCCQGHSVFESCQISIIISVAYPFLFSHPTSPLP